MRQAEAYVVGTDADLQAAQSDFDEAAKALSRDFSPGPEGQGFSPALPDHAVKRELRGEKSRLACLRFK
jgi:hypothetical protein